MAATRHKYGSCIIVMTAVLYSAIRIATAMNTRRFGFYGKMHDIKIPSVTSNFHSQHSEEPPLPTALAKVLLLIE
jgi:hypothetical protein